MLEEGVSDHRHKRMTVKALPGSSLEMVKTKFFFHLLVSLLANPTRLDGGGLARIVPRNGQDQVLLSSAGEPARKPNAP